MANPLQTFLQKKNVAAYWGRCRVIIVGLARDFWKDGTENPFKRHKKGPANPQAVAAEAGTVPASAKTSSIPEWHAAPGEISEKMWGKGFVAPGGDEISDMLTMPLGLNKQMSVLDLSAGLGGRMRKATEEFGVYITGLEPDAEIAARGMEMSVMMGKGKHDIISAYVPAEFTPGKTVTRTYDCIIARETFYRVADRPKFFEALAAVTKPQAQISFTDYIINPEDREKPVIAAWMKCENGVNPAGLVEMAEAWAKAGFKLRVHDDQTDFYRREVLAGLKRFSQFLGSGVQPDAATRKAIFRRTESWTHRIAALEQGMKFYRFYGTK